MEEWSESVTLRLSPNNNNTTTKMDEIIALEQTIGFHQTETSDRRCSVGTVHQWIPRRTNDFPVIDRNRQRVFHDEDEDDEDDENTSCEEDDDISQEGTLIFDNSHHNQPDGGPNETIKGNHSLYIGESNGGTLEFPYVDEFNNVFYFQCMSKPKRNRTTFTAVQLIYLEKIFRSNQYLIGVERKLLAKYLDLTETQIKVWFQNRRTKDRKKPNCPNSGDGF